MGRGFREEYEKGDCGRAEGRSRIVCVKRSGPVKPSGNSYLAIAAYIAGQLNASNRRCLSVSTAKHRAKQVRSRNILAFCVHPTMVTHKALFQLGRPPMIDDIFCAAGVVAYSLLQVRKGGSEIVKEVVSEIHARDSFEPSRIRAGQGPDR